LNGGSVISSSGGVGGASGSLGTVTISGTGSTWTSSGAVSIGSSLVTTGVLGRVNLDDGGKLIVNGTSGLTIWSSGALTGSGGTVQGKITNYGLLGTGILTVSSSFTQYASGKLAIGIASANEFDRLTVSGLAVLGGTLEISLLNGFVPASGSQFDILDWSTRINTFSTIALPALPGGKAWNTSLLYTSGVLSVTGPPPVPGDFDSDGDVDGADFVAWQTNFPKLSDATLAQGDADEDGDVDGADFVTWQTHFPYSPAAGASPVPEPAALISSLLALLTLTTIRPRKPHRRLSLLALARCFRL
jgi:T5SS/PEP-CTERM-associated repeat protein